MPTTTDQRWFRATKTEVGRCVVGAVNAIASKQAGRRPLATRRIEAYTGHRMPTLGATSFETSSVNQRLVPVPIVQSIVDAGKALIASKQRPKPQVLTKGANYRHRIQARKISRFLEGVQRQPQGMYANSWDLTETCFRDCEVTEGGVIKIWPDVQNKRIAHDRCFSWELFVDPLEAEHGCPRNLFHRYKYDKFTLAARFPNREREIMGAGLHADDRGASVSELDMCSVYEAWRLPIGKDIPGRHVIALDVNGHNVLADEPWTWNGFPFVIITWERNWFGIWGTPLVDQILDMQERLGETFTRVIANLGMLSGGIVDAEQGAYEESELEAGGMTLKVVERKPGTMPANITMPPIVNPQVLEILQLQRTLCNDLSGVGEMVMHGQKDPGLNSGRAIITANDLQGSRFLPKSQAYEQAIVEIGRRDIWAAKDLAKAGVEMVVSYKAASGLMDEIDWKTIAPEDDDRFEVSIQASSSLEDTLAGRRQILSEMRDMGELSPELASAALSDPNPDVDALNTRQRAQHRYLERIIGRFQEADEDTWDEKVDFEPPDPHLDMPKAVMQMIDGYIEMLADDAPLFNRDLILRWVKYADQIEARKQAGAQAAAPPPGPPMPPPGPGNAAPMPQAGPPMGMAAE